MTDETYLGYSVLSRAWYADANLAVMRTRGVTDSISFGRYAHEGGCDWEAQFELHAFTSDPAWRVSLFDESWPAFVAHPDLFRGLAEVGNGATLADVERELQNAGFVDRTETRRGGEAPTLAELFSRSDGEVEHVDGDPTNNALSNLRIRRSE
jgi:hypothetical protein